MAVFTFLGAAGAPGATTSCLALATAWPGTAVVVEADPAGSSAVMAGHLLGQLPGVAGIIEAAVAQRSGTLDREWQSLLVDLPGSRARLMAGLANPAQRPSMAAEWQHLGPALTAVAAERGVDLFVDGGRLGSPGLPGALVAQSESVFLTCRSTLRSVHATSVWIDQLLELLPQPDQLQLLVVGPGQPYSTREIAGHLGLPSAAELPWDPDAAAWYSDGQPLRRRRRQSLPAAAARWARALVAPADTERDTEPEAGASAADTAREPAIQGWFRPKFPRTGPIAGGSDSRYGPDAVTTAAPVTQTEEVLSHV